MSDSLVPYSAFVEFCIHCATLALLFYDHVLTLNSEIFFIWRSNARVGKILFLFNRYFALASNVTTIAVPFTTLNNSSCRHYLKWCEVSLAITELFVIVLMMLRVYALYNQSRAALAILCTASITVCAIGGWITISSRIAANGKQETANCNDRGAGLARAWEVLLAMDVLMFIMVLIKGIQENGWRGKMRHSLVHCIIRDGAIYFLVMVAVNLANIMTYYLADTPWKGFLARPSANISVLAVSRLMLRLHETTNAKTAPNFSFSQKPVSTGIEMEWRREETSVLDDELC
ncbi:hypothetical protein NEOLEDRAFT_1130172 [Neolentinus lepideus HHB14362 ss-1]|uniref:DUF6533 domain-containing protein n=1 Tax=Neolentinus lepideus HHB14362 ss-1 TaxID=1314782 RepID=A0A165UHN8_9AGAM|nr:hypothetical protein NEOLEDRAFT_1130172 [Neolentinus lepideus HHB14362 ss-1]